MDPPPLWSVEDAVGEDICGEDGEGGLRLGPRGGSLEVEADEMS